MGAVLQAASKAIIITTLVEQMGRQQCFWPPAAEAWLTRHKAQILCHPYEGPAHASVGMEGSFPLWALCNKCHLQWPVYTTTS